MTSTDITPASTDPSDRPSVDAQLPGESAGSSDHEFADTTPRPEHGDHRRAFGSVGRAIRVTVAVALAMVLLMMVGLVTGIAHLSNPFGSRSTDRSQPALLLSIQNLARFQAASGNFQVIVDVTHDKAHIPDFLYSQRSLFIASGTVGAYVDFSHLGPASVTTTSDRHTAVIKLPAPALDTPAIDPAHSYVYADQKGLVNKLEDLVSSNPGHENQLYQLADQKLAAAAADSQLVQRAQTNTTAMLTGMLHTLGFTTVTVTFPTL